MRPKGHFNLVVMNTEIRVMTLGFGDFGHPIDEPNRSLEVFKLDNPLKPAQSNLPLHDLPAQFDNPSGIQFWPPPLAGDAGSAF